MRKRLTCLVLFWNICTADLGDTGFLLLLSSVPKIGQFAKELGPVYVAYGKALTQLGIHNKDSLLNAGAMPESVIEGLAADRMGGNDLKKRKVVDLDHVHLEGDADGHKAADEPSEPETETDAETDTEAGEDENQAVEADASDEFELAWEVLDIARLIYADSASVNPEHKAALSDIFCDLGSISMETESFSQAADDFSKALEIKKSLGPGHERDVSSCYFQYAVALEYDNQVAAAVEPLTAARDLLKRRLIRLQGDDDKGKEKTLMGVTLDVEVKELEQLLPEVEAKLEDLRSQLCLASPNAMDVAHIKATLNAAALGAAQDLSGLVRKRKPEEGQ